MAHLARRSYVLGAVALVVPLLAITQAGAAVSPARVGGDPALGLARSFVVSKQQNDGGFEVAKFASFETPDAILALGELAQTGPTWNAAAARSAVLSIVKSGKTPLDYVDDQVEAADLAPAVAAKYLTLVVIPLGLNPRDVDPSNDSPQPVDLVQAIGKGADLDGRYRKGAFNGLLYVGLAQWARGCAVPGDLVARIKAAQQANGSWDFSGDPSGTGVDVDTTGLVVISLTRAGLGPADPTVAKALTLLARQHRANGSWQATVFPPFVDDPNTTSLATLAIAATGQDPASAAWRNAAAPELAAEPYTSPDSWLRSRQQPDGHIASPVDSFGVNTFATSQSIEALTRRWFTSKPASTTPCALPGGLRERFLRSEFRTLSGRIGTNADLQPAATALGSDVTVKMRRFAAVSSTLRTDAYRRRAVADLYQRALGRTPDSAAHSYWADRLRSISRQSVLASLLGSNEFFTGAGATNSGFLDDLYPIALGRAADSGGKAYWLRRLSGGATRRTIAVGMVVSGEGRRTEVEAQYRDLLDRSPSAERLAFWTGELASERVERLIATLVSSEEYLTQVTG